MLRTTVFVLLFVFAASETAGHRQKRSLSQYAWMYPCKEQFVSEREAAFSDVDRCTAWKTYVSCLLRAAVNSEDNFPWNELQQIREYKNALNDSCELTDACQCEYLFLTRYQTPNTQMYNFGSSGYKYRRFIMYTNCLENSLMSGCDGSSPSTLLMQARSLRSSYTYTKSEKCSSVYGYSNYAPEYYQIESYIDCIEPLSTTGMDLPLTYSEAYNLGQKVNRSEYCEIQMSDSCLCELEFLKAAQDYVDSCSAATEYVSCLETCYMSGCQQVSKEVLKATADATKRNYCPAEVDDCTGVQSCNIDMTMLSIATPEAMEESCKSMKGYVMCLESVPTTCKAAAHAIAMIHELYEDKYKCAAKAAQPVVCQCTATDTTTDTNTDTDSDTDTNGDTNTDTVTNNNDGSSSSSSSSVSVSGNLLAAFIEDAKLEAQETLHEAEESVDVLTDTQQLANLM